MGFPIFFLSACGFCRVILHQFRTPFDPSNSVNLLNFKEIFKFNVLAHSVLINIVRAYVVYAKYIIVIKIIDETAMNKRYINLCV